MTRQELGLLLYLETRAVDHGGRVNLARMNSDDIENAVRWNEEGFVRFGRILSGCIIPGNRLRTSTCWCELSDAAWEAAHAERMARGKRSMHDPEIRTETQRESA